MKFELLNFFKLCFILCG